MHSQSDYNRLNLLSRRAEEVMNQGDFDAARRFATEMFSLDPNNLAGFLVYTNSGRMSADDPVTQRLLAIGDGKALDRPIRTMILFLQGRHWTTWAITRPRSTSSCWRTRPTAGRRITKRRANG